MFLEDFMRAARLLTQFTIVVVGALTLAACGKSPAAPSSTGSVSINGSIVAPGGSAAGSEAASSASPAPAGLQVSVNGTNISALVDAAGKFELKNVPPGNADLRFTAPAFSAALALSELQSGETVTLSVSLSGSTEVVLESQRRSSGSEEQLEGRVESLPPTSPAGGLTVAGRTVTTDANTLVYLRGQASSFAALELGQRVHVKGQTSGANLLARLIDIQNTNTGVGLPINGVVSNFSGDEDEFEFMVNGQLIKGDSDTEFFGNSQFLYLMNGAQVEVKGSQRSGFVYAVRIHVETEEAEFTGVITTKAGTSPELTFTIGGKKVLTTEDTEVKRGGDEQSVDVLYINQTVEVSGRLLANGDVIAKKISIVADAVGGIFEMEGSVGGKSGACPTLSFSVAGYSIATSLATTYPGGGSCAGLSNGNKVLVKGTFGAGLVVAASSVQKQ
jgi:hypothetical protein